MIAKGLQPHTIKIDKPIMLAAKGARQKYSLYLEEQTKLKLVMKKHEEQFISQQISTK